jgi:hypothetical protein
MVITTVTKIASSMAVMALAISLKVGAAPSSCVYVCNLLISWEKRDREVVGTETHGRHDGCLVD